jgi:zinc protease
MKMKTPSSQKRQLLAAALLLWWAAASAVSPSEAANPSAKRLVLKNGLVLLILPERSLPLVQIQVIVKAGALYEPDEKAGLASLVADLLDEGTRRRSATEIADAIDFVGGSLGAGSGDDWASASLRVLKKDLPLGMDLLSDILLHPSFPEAELERRRKQVLGNLMAQKDEPGVIAAKTFSERVFGPHPYHRPVEGTEESLPRITREDLVQFYDQYYRPNNTIMAMVGDITEKEARDLMARYFGSWPSRPTPKPAIRPAPRLEKKVVEPIDKQLTQANVVLGHLGIDRKNPDYYSVVVMNYILGGGGFSSRLVTEIRENQGLAYSVSSRFTASTDPGSFSVSLQTENGSARKAIEAVLAEIKKIRETPVTDQEIEDAKSFLIGSFPLRMDTTGEIASLLAQVEYFGLGPDYFEEYPKRIGAVGKEDVLRVAKKYLDPERFVLVVVAKQDQAKIGKEP